MKTVTLLLALISHVASNLLMPGIYTEVVEIQQGKVEFC